MRKLVVHEFMTLDGVVQAPGAPDEDREGGFEHGGWVVPHIDDALGEAVTEWVQPAGALLLGRKTYEIFAASWPLLADDDPIAAVYNHIPKYVVSRTLERADWDPSTIIRDDIPAAVARLKAEGDGELQVHGSADLAQTLLAHDLIDEFRLLLIPALAGSGKRLFASGTLPRGLRLTASRALPTGVQIMVYERAGDVAVGAYGPEIEAG